MDLLCLDCRKLGERGALIVRAWNKFEEITHQCFLTSLGQHVPLKINLGFARVWRKYFFGEDDVFHMKEFRTTLTYIILY